MRGSVSSKEKRNFFSESDTLGFTPVARATNLSLVSVFSTEWSRFSHALQTLMSVSSPEDFVKMQSLV